MADASTGVGGAGETQVSGRLTLGRAQLLWAVLGLTTVIVIAVLAFGNLQQIFDSQKDFIVGLLASLAGVCFTRAFSRAAEDKALELIRANAEGPVRDELTERATELIRQAPEGPVRDAVVEKAVGLIHASPSGPVGDALTEIERQRLDQRGAFEHIALLERNIDAAQDRISEYYQAQAQNLDFHRNAPLLRVVLDDLDNVSVNANRLRHAIQASSQDRGYRIASKERLALISIRRDLRESLERRTQAYEQLLNEASVPIQRQTWDVFAVMTADILKADRQLDTLLSQHVRFPPEDCLRTSIGYLEAAAHRAAEFADSLGDVPVPKVFDIMLTDLTSARAALTRIDLPDAGPEPRAAAFTK